MSLTNSPRKDRLKQVGNEEDKDIRPSGRNRALYRCGYINVTTDFIAS